MVNIIFVTALTAVLALGVCLPIENNEFANLADNSIGDENTATLKPYYIDLAQYGSSLYGIPDKETTGNAVAEYSAESNVNPEELGSYFEGDILIPRQRERNGMSSLSLRWPKGIVPFEIRGHFNAREMALIEQAINEFHRNTCIRFVPRLSETDYISIVGGRSGCWSSVGRIGGKQEVNLQAHGCLIKQGTPIHELMHAVGFLHEQNRSERDNYVTIHFENIQPSAVSNFDKAPADKTTSFGVPYDYGSVMHYSTNAFTMNGNPTIEAKQPGAGTKMGQRDGFSAFDIQKINTMYNCNVGLAPVIPVPPGLAAVLPRPVPVGPRPQGLPSNLLTSFLGGLISGLGLGEEPSTEEPKE